MSFSIPEIAIYFNQIFLLKNKKERPETPSPRWRSRQGRIGASTPFQPNFCIRAREPRRTRPRVFRKKKSRIVLRIPRS